MHNRNKKHDNAIEYFSNAIDVLENMIIRDVDIYIKGVVFRGQAHFQKKNYFEAIEVYNKAISIDYNEVKRSYVYVYTNKARSICQLYKGEEWNSELEEQVIEIFNLVMKTINQAQSSVGDDIKSRLRKMDNKMYLEHLQNDIEDVIKNKNKLYDFLEFIKRELGSGLEL